MNKEIEKCFEMILAGEISEAFKILDKERFNLSDNTLIKLYLDLIMKFNQDALKVKTYIEQLVNSIENKTELIEKCLEVSIIYEFEQLSVNLINLINENESILNSEKKIIFENVISICEKNKKELFLNNLIDKYDLKEEFKIISIDSEEISFTKKEISLFYSLFKGRLDVYAQQVLINKNWGYIPKRFPYNQSVVTHHLYGDMTVGIYTVLTDNTSNFLAFDIDIKKHIFGICKKDINFSNEVFVEMKNYIGEIYNTLKAKFNSILEYSGNKGYHIWIIFEEPVSARALRTAAKIILEKYINKHQWFNIEVFPKQDTIKPGALGNLIKLPCGIHKKSQKRSFFIDVKTKEKVKNIGDFLENYQLNRRDIIYKIIENEQNNEKQNKKSSVNFLDTKVEFKSVTDQEDFDEKIKLSTIEYSCNVIKFIIDRAKAELYIEDYLKHILIYVFAKFGLSGNKKIHSILSNCYDYDADLVDKKIKSVPDFPISCPKIRKHLKKFKSIIPCRCSFDLEDGEYPSPVLYGGYKINNSGKIHSKPKSGTAVKSEFRIIYKYFEIIKELINLTRVNKSLDYNQNYGSKDVYVNAERIDLLRNNCNVLERKILELYEDGTKIELPYGKMIISKGQVFTNEKILLDSLK